MSVEKRRQAEAAGRRAETLAAWFLRCKGYRVLERGFRTPMGEIDLIVKRGRTVVFVEVKRRESRDAALYAVTRKQRHRIEAAAGAYLARYAGAAPDVRFDIVAIGHGIRWGLPLHLADAWRPGF